jgi:hypothetical protein
MCHPLLVQAQATLLDRLERATLGVSFIERWMLGAHERAFRRLLRGLPAPRRVLVVGGGLFPRTLVVLARLFPAAEVVVVDGSRDSLERAGRWLRDHAVPCGRVRFEHRRWQPGELATCDLLVLPLALRGARVDAYARPGAPRVVVHDWLWRARGRSVVVAWPLLKRLNRVGAA